MNQQRSKLFFVNLRRLGKSYLQEQLCTQQIMMQREEILSAFIAKYGIQPDEAVQVIQQNEHTITWCVKRKGEVGQRGEPSGL